MFLKQKKLIDNGKVTLVVYPEKKIVHHTIHDFIFGDDFKNLILTAADAYEKHNCTKWLSDDSGNSAMRQQDLEWAQQGWEPRILKAGWKFWALIFPEKVLGQLNMKPLVQLILNWVLLCNFLATQIPL